MSRMHTSWGHFVTLTCNLGQMTHFVTVTCKFGERGYHSPVSAVSSEMGYRWPGVFEENRELRKLRNWEWGASQAFPFDTTMKLTTRRATHFFRVFLFSLRLWLSFDVLRSRKTFRYLWTWKMTDVFYKWGGQRVRILSARELHFQCAPQRKHYIWPPRLEPINAEKI